MIVRVRCAESGATAAITAGREETSSRAAGSQPRTAGRSESTRRIRAGPCRVAERRKHQRSGTMPRRQKLAPAWLGARALDRIAVLRSGRNLNLAPRGVRQSDVVRAAGAPPRGKTLWVTRDEVSSEPARETWSCSAPATTSGRPAVAIPQHRMERTRATRSSRKLRELHCALLSRGHTRFEKRSQGHPLRESPPTGRADEHRERTRRRGRLHALRHASAMPWETAKLDAAHVAAQDVASPRRACDGPGHFEARIGRFHEAPEPEGTLLHTGP